MQLKIRSTATIIFNALKCFLHDSPFIDNACLSFFLPLSEIRIKAPGMDIPVELLRASRVALGMSQAELARAAGVAVRTVAKMETSGRVLWETRQKIKKALESKGIKFLDRDESNGFGMRLPLGWSNTVE